MDLVPVAAFILLFPTAALLALPALCDAWAWAAGRLNRSKHTGRSQKPAAERLLFLVPAHNEEDLIGRCVASLRNQDYPLNKVTIVVVADHCDDRTASIARDGGAVVLERRGGGGRGKHHAIGWATERISLCEYAAVVLIDADTVVDPSFSRAVVRHAPLENVAIQSYDGLSNEFENWLTRMAGVLTRNRWDMVLHWKEAADLNCPLTGDGSVLGTRVLERFPWNVETITEGWELYARLTLAGVRILYEPGARVYAQETRWLGQSASQRQRWSSGRIAVFRRYARTLLTKPGIPLVQRLDLIAELSSTGPIMRAFLGAAGIAALLAFDTPAAPVLIALFAAPIVEPLGMSLASLARHPHPAATVRAFTRLPAYALWRVGVGFSAFFLSGKDAWIRTGRHTEDRGR